MGRNRSLANVRATTRARYRLPVEHFRCERKAVTLLRSSCAGAYYAAPSRASKSLRFDPCLACPIGLAHNLGEVADGAPTVASPAPFRPPPKSDPLGTEGLRGLSTAGETVTLTTFSAKPEDPRARRWPVGS